MKLLDGEIKPGDRIKVTVEKGALKFHRPNQTASGT